MGIRKQESNECDHLFKGQECTSEIMGEERNGDRTSSFVDDAQCDAIRFSSSSFPIYFLCFFFRLKFASAECGTPSERTNEQTSGGGRFDNIRIYSNARAQTIVFNVRVSALRTCNTILKRQSRGLERPERPELASV